MRCYEKCVSYPKVLKDLKKETHEIAEIYNETMQHFSIGLIYHK